MCFIHVATLSLLWQRKVGYKSNNIKRDGKTKGIACRDRDLLSFLVSRKPLSIHPLSIHAQASIVVYVHLTTTPSSPK